MTEGPFPVYLPGWMGVWVVGGCVQLQLRAGMQDVAIHGIPCFRKTPGKSLLGKHVFTV
jgi:hypothetical protein